MIESSTALVTVIVITAICLVYSLAILVIKKLFAPVDEEYKNMRTGNTFGSDNSDKEAFLAMIVIGADQRALSFKDQCDRIVKESVILYTYQSISLVVAAVLFSLTFLIWFSVDGQYVWFLIPFLLGCLIVALNTYVTLVFSSYARVRTLFAAQDEKDVIFSESYIINNSITTAVLSIFIFTLLFLIPGLQSFYFDSFAEKDNAKNFLFNSLSFSMGVCLAAVFYRDLGGNFGKSVSIGSDYINESLKELNSSQGVSANNTLKQGAIVGNMFTSNVTSLLDLQCLIATLVTGALLITDGKDKMRETVMYLTVYLLSVNMLLTCVVSWLSKLLAQTFQKESTSTYVATQIRVQYIVINVISFLLLLVLPVELVPAKIELGKDGAKEPSFFNSEISQPDLVWSLQTGQVAAFLIIFVSELWTSYGFNLVKSIAKKFKSVSFSDGIVSAENQGGIATSIMLVGLSLTLLLAYYFGGVLGLSWVAIGVIQTAPMLLGVCFFSTATHDAVEIAEQNGLKNIANRLRLVNWSANNFSSFISVLNLSAGFFVNLMCVAAVMYLSETQKQVLFEGTTVLGLLLSVSLILLVRAINNTTVADSSQELIQNGQLVRVQKFEESNLKSLNHLVLKIFTPSFFSALFSITTTITFVLIAAVALGKSALVGLALGLSLFGTAASFQQLLVGTSLRNAQNYLNQTALITGEAGGKGEFNHASKESGFFAQALHSIPGTGLQNYIHFALLLLTIGAKVFKDYGYLDSFLEKSSSDVSGSTVNWYLDLLNGSGSTGTTTATTDAPAAAPAAAAAAPAA